MRNLEEMLTALTRLQLMVEGKGAYDAKARAAIYKASPYVASQPGNATAEAAALKQLEGAYWDALDSARRGLPGDQAWYQNDADTIKDELKARGIAISSLKPPAGWGKAPISKKL